MQKINPMMLKKMLATYKPINDEQSLPFAIEENHAMKIRWFIYDNKSKQDRYVKRIITIDSDGRAQIFLNPQIPIEAACEFTTNNIDRYYDRFCDLFNRGYINNLDYLLQTTENENTIDIYEKVMMFDKKYEVTE